jgi:hypothetical protein
MRHVPLAPNGRFWFLGYCGSYILQIWVYLRKSASY